MNKFSILAIILMLSLQMGCSKDPAGITTGTIKGKIVDSSTNTAISGVVVSTSPASSAVTSDDSGYYQIDEVNAGAYTILAAKSGYDNASASISVEGGKVVDANLALAAITAAPAVPVLVTPVDSIFNVILQPAFNWNPTSGAASYCIQIAKDSTFTNLAEGSAGLYINCYQTQALAESTVYYWRVNASNSIGISGWSEVWSIKTGSAATGNTRPNQPTTPIGPSAGHRGQSYSFDFTCSDPDQSYGSLYFRADWGDGTQMNWQETYSGWYTYSLSHVFGKLGNYLIHFQAMDVYGDTSLWSAPCTIDISNLVPSSPYNNYPDNGNNIYSSYYNFSWSCVDSEVPYDTVKCSMLLDTLNPPTKIVTTDITTDDYYYRNYVSGMVASKKYYWKIVAYDRSGDSTVGPIWYFYTGTKK